MPRCDDDPSDIALDPDVLVAIGRQLHELFDHIVAEPVPDRLKALLDRLDAAERAVRLEKRSHQTTE
jgi:hypothetical protein